MKGKYLNQDPQRLYAERRPLRGGEDIVRPAWRHAEPGRNDLAVAEQFCVVTNVPKVEVPVSCPGTAPARSDPGKCSWLFAGNPEYPAVLITVTGPS